MIRLVVSIALLLAAGPISTGPTLSAVGPRERCPVPPNDQLWVPGGTARFGSDQAYADEGPSYTARVRGFWIDRHEVTNAQYAAFVHATGHVTRAEKDGGSAVFDPPGPLDRPTSPDQWWRYVKGAN
jgi:sulfatase modifying factor 1